MSSAGFHIQTGGVIGMTHALLNYFIKRLLLFIPVVLGVMTITFFLMRVVPGDPASFVAGGHADQATLEHLRREMKLDLPLWLQYLNYLDALLHGDLGRSWTSTGQPVTVELAERLPATLELSFLAIIITAVVGISLGMSSAIRRSTILKNLARSVEVGSVSLPVFWVGLILILVFYFQLGIAPPPLGRLDPRMTPPTRITGLFILDSILSANWPALESSLTSIALPAITLAIPMLASVTRMTRTAIAHELEQDYVMVARAAGIAWRDIVRKDALKNALRPILTVVGMIFPSMIAGNVLVEAVFAWPGIGSYLVYAILSTDYAPVQGVILVIAIAYASINLAVDIMYAFVDPRIRYE